MISKSHFSTRAPGSVAGNKIASSGGAKRSKKHAAGKKAAGLVKVTGWIPVGLARWIADEAAEMRRTKDATLTSLLDGLRQAGGLPFLTGTKLLTERSLLKAKQETESSARLSNEVCDLTESLSDAKRDAAALALKLNDSEERASAAENTVLKLNELFVKQQEMALKATRRPDDLRAELARPFGASSVSIPVSMPFTKPTREAGAREVRAALTGLFGQDAASTTKYVVEVGSDFDAKIFAYEDGWLVMVSDNPRAPVLVRKVGEREKLLGWDKVRSVRIAGNRQGEWVMTVRW
jgi:hypothetical protein